MRPVAILLCLAAGLAPAAEPTAGGGGDPFADLNLEAHGFASFGLLRSWERPYLTDESLEGSTDLWEAAVNATARPLDRLRLGAQIFARDLGRYDNGQPTLDWAYADWRAADAFGIQAGRCRVPFGLYNEVIDVDAARTPVFLPNSVYPLVNRDLFISTDGVRVYGYAGLGRAGAIDYSLSAGGKSFDVDLATGTFFVERGLAETVEEIEMELGLGAMLHWYAPCDGLGLRVSLLDGHGFSVRGTSPSLGAQTYMTVDDYLVGALSVLWERGDWTVAAEYARYHASGEVAIAPFGLIEGYRDDSDGGYVSGTWHLRQWCELYAAGEALWWDAKDRSAGGTCTAVLAINLMPVANWSLKAEGRFNRELGAAAADWQALALKTTVDF